MKHDFAEALQRIAPPEGKGRNQERLTTPLPSRLAQGSEGDVLVSLSSGLAGKRLDHRDVARDLGLDRWGDQVLGDRLDPTFMGKVAEISELVTVTYYSGFLTPELVRVEIINALNTAKRHVPGTNVLAPAISERKNAFAGLEKVVRRAISMVPNSDGLSGSIYELADDEYVQVESSDESGVVVWSSDLPVSDALICVQDTLGKPSSDDNGYVVHDDGESEVTSQDAERLVLSQPDTVRLIVATYGDAQVSWREPQLKLKGARREHVEFCYRATSVRWSVLKSLMQATGTDNVKRSLKSLRGPVVRALGQRGIV